MSVQYMGASILYPTPRKIWKNMKSDFWPDLTGFGSFNLLLTSGTIKIESGIVDLLGIFWFPASGDFSRPDSCKIRIFPRVFTHFLDPNFLRYGQDLYQAHTSPSRASSLPIGLLYLQHPLPIFALQNFFEIFLRYSQSLYKTHIRKSCSHPSL